MLIFFVNDKLYLVLWLLTFMLYLGMIVKSTLNVLDQLINHSSAIHVVAINTIFINTILYVFYVVYKYDFNKI